MRRSFSTRAIATLAMCVLLSISPVLFWAGCNRIFEDHATLEAALRLTRAASIVGFIVFVGVFYARRWPTDVAGVLAWVSPIVALNVAGVALIAVGQWLTHLVYRRLGPTGVYYGLEYGLVAPDPTISQSFPFNSMRHPQYIGCILTALGIWALTALDRHDRGIRWPIALIAVVTVATYVAGMVVEDVGCN